VQQALLAGSVDAASILEPVLTIVLDRDPSARVVTYGGQMMPNQPGAVLAVRSEVLKEKPDVVQKLVDMHNRATAMIISDPKRAAKHVHDVIGRGLIPAEMIEKAIVSPYAKYESNPHKIVESTRTMHDFQAKIGTLRKPVPLDQLFDTTAYDTVTVEVQ
jgi:NitT/TauT family transport system substrate-binding protein